MTTDQYVLEKFLNDLEGEIVAIIPNVTLGFFLGSPGGFSAHSGESRLIKDRK